MLTTAPAARVSPSVYIPDAVEGVIDSANDFGIGKVVMTLVPDPGIAGAGDPNGGDGYWRFQYRCGDKVLTREVGESLDRLLYWIALWSEVVPDGTLPLQATLTVSVSGDQVTQAISTERGVQYIRESRGRALIAQVDLYWDDECESEESWVSTDSRFLRDLSIDLVSEIDELIAFSAA